jgi:nucleotide-binding universal stress UspA family protein
MIVCGTRLMSLFERIFTQSISRAVAGHADTLAIVVPPKVRYQALRS